MLKDFESFLVDRHAEQYTGLDDEMPDDYERWLSELDANDFLHYGQLWGESILKSLGHSTDIRVK